MASGRGLLTLLACAYALAAPAADAASPSLLWAGAKRVAVNCLVQSETTGDAPRFQATLCGRVETLAARGAPVPVMRVQAGDASFVRSDAVVLLVHASVERGTGGRIVAFSIRPYRASGGEAEVYYGTAPRAITIPAARPSPALDAALSAALSDVLPWQQRQALHARPIK